uniref:Uncharacterized protein n=1 Tax=Arundo donax TaxID=35708 RepID=A0A0A8ZGU8_ARUDO
MSNFTCIRLQPVFVELVACNSCTVSCLH